MTDICYTHYETPLGKTLLAADERGLRLISFAAGKRPEHPESHWRKDPAPLQETIRQLRAYFPASWKNSSCRCPSSARNFSFASGNCFRPFLTAKPLPTANWLDDWANPTPRERSAWQTDRIRFPSSFHAIASSAAMAAWSVMGAAFQIKKPCSRSKAARDACLFPEWKRTLVST